ncbi:MAG: class I tRNA ligase family protein, partial [Coriobacteriales bacterium]|nr:class I tRNA ligase family protein [Coriobacteriales bacterium]
MEQTEEVARAQRPSFPKRAIVTAGMPYGNKGLHFGHIGGVFVPADVFARFLRDRIGPQNVLFVCGTDCYGSPIDEGYRRLTRDEGFTGSIADYVRANHDAQAATLRSYDISLDIFEGSGLGKAKTVHEDFTRFIIQRLYDNGHLHRVTTAQFFDEEAQSFLNGRQVTGRCPVPGCKSEHAYADECDLGHQYMPADLIAPISALSGKTPVMRDVSNWYFDLPSFRELLKDYVEALVDEGQTRAVVSTTIDEFLVPPIIYVKNECADAYAQLAEALPAHQ